jgi:hypothetical protein
MSAVKRRLFNVLAAGSLVLCVATLSLWVRGNWQCDHVRWFSANYGVSFASANSVMMLTIGPNYKGTDALPLESGWRYTHYSAHDAGQQMVRCQIPIAEYHRLGWLGFAYDPNRLETYHGPPKFTEYSSHRLYFPHWWFAATTSVLPAIWYWQRRRQRVRTKLRRCVSCGYDLRATPERCPECGMMSTR